MTVDELLGHINQSRDSAEYLEQGEGEGRGEGWRQRDDVWCQRVTCGVSGGWGGVSGVRGSVSRGEVASAN